MERPLLVSTVFLVFSNKQAGIGPISAELPKVGEGESYDKSIILKRNLYSHSIGKILVNSFRIKNLQDARKILIRY
jgi:hypothetical protein